MRQQTITLPGRVTVHVRDAEWREDQHRRDEQGRFTSHGAAAAHREGHRDLGIGAAHYRLMREAHDPVSGLRTFSLRRTDTTAAHLHQVSVDPAGNIVRHTLTPPGANSRSQMLSPQESMRYSGMHQAIQAQAQNAPGRGAAETPRPPSSPPSSPRRARRAGAPTVEAAQALRSDLASYGPGSAPLVNYFRPRLAQIDAALQQPDPLPALQAINVANTRYTRIVTYLSAMIEAHGGEPLVPASRQTQQLRAITGGRQPQAPQAPRSAPPPPSSTAHEDFSSKVPQAPRRPIRSTLRPDQEESFRQQLNGKTPQQLYEATIAGFDQSTDARSSHLLVAYGQNGFATISQISMPEGTAEVQRQFDLENKSVYHAYQVLPTSARGGKIAAKNLAASVKAYREAGLKEVRVSAGLSVGGYAWARYGFLPDRYSWSNIAGGARRRLDSSGATPEQRQHLEAILSSPDPKAMWALADHPLGKHFLLGTSWSGRLNLEDPAQYNRCMRYATREEGSTAGARATRRRA